MIGVFCNGKPLNEVDKIVLMNIISILIKRLKTMSEKIFYLTKEKHGELKREHKHLLTVEFHKTRGEDVPKLFESEDLNPEFVDFQEDLSLTRSRIFELENIFKNYEIIKKPAPEHINTVGIGSTVTVEVNGEKDEFTIMGTLEASPNLRRISNDSPVGRALLGKKAGETVFISSPVETTYKIKKVRYFLS